MTIKAYFEEAGSGRKPVRINIVDFSAFVHAGPEEYVPVFPEDGNESQFFVLKKTLTDLEVVSL
jgi:hypothetical protein